MVCRSLRVRARFCSQIAARCVSFCRPIAIADENNARSASLSLPLLSLVGVSVVVAFVVFFLRIAAEERKTRASSAQHRLSAFKTAAIICCHVGGRECDDARLLCDRVWRSRACEFERVELIRIIVVLDGCTRCNVDCACCRRNCRGVEHGDIFVVKC